MHKSSMQTIGLQTPLSRHKPLGYGLVVLLLACLFIGLSASPAKGQGITRNLERLFAPGPPLEPAAEEVFDGHRLGGLSLREYLLPLDFEGCMTTVREDLVAGLNRVTGVRLWARLRDAR